MSQGHDASHGHDAGHAEVAAGAAHGSVEIPSEPPVRTISPAAADLPFPLPLPGLLWPVVWLGVAFLLVTAVRRSHGEVETPHAQGEHAAPAHGEGAHGEGHETPAHGEK